VKSLTEILENAQKHKFLGPSPVNEHIKNGMGFVEVLSSLSLEPSEPHTIVDLGSGGGVPAFVIANSFPHWNFLLVERKVKRAEFLKLALEKADFGTNIEVFVGQAENAARERKNEEKADFVTARSFAAPPITAECGCRFLKKGGYLVVSEPPTASGRWPSTGLGPLGLEPVDTKQPTFGTFQALELKTPPEQRYPRRSSAMRKNPLW